MKRFSFLLFVYLLSTFRASSQSHFITAGQTQGMIFTDYVPHFSFTTPTHSGSHNDNESLALDLNKDNRIDFRMSKSYSGGLAGGYTTYSLKPEGLNMVLCKYDTTHRQNNSSYYNSDTSFHAVCKKYFAGDTLKNSNDTLWKNSSVVIQSSYWIAGSSGILTDYILPSDTPCYYFVKIIPLVNTNDTLLGYIHFSTANKLFDFACEGTTSSHIISSTNNLSPSNISISPNPFTNQINISTEKPFEYQIVDYMGRVVLSGMSDKTINTTQLNAGGYFLILKNEEILSVKKIVKPE